MKITEFKTTVVDIPLEKRIKTSIHDMKSVGCVLLELKTDQELIGQSYVFSLNAVRIAALEAAVSGFSDRVLGRDPHYVHRILEDMWADMNTVGHQGYPIAAMSAVDVACWDLIGQSANLPLHYLFGACRDRIPTYASGGLWLSASIDELIEEAQKFIDQGFRAMKIRLGSEKIVTDIERVRAVRDAIGPDIELLSDANQGLDVKKAIRLAKQLEEFDVGWFEEPVNYLDLDGHARVRQAATIPIASGETEYTRFGMHKMLKAGAVDVLMPDLQRIGGLTEMRRSAAIASVHHIPISTHIFTHQSLCIAGSEPNCISVEHMPWFDCLFNEVMKIEQGDILIPDRPGIGFTLNPEVIARYKIS